MSVPRLEANPQAQGTFLTPSPDPWSCEGQPLVPVWEGRRSHRREGKSKVANVKGGGINQVW